ncbi:phage tail tape measure protein [Paenarthrobacter sp. OM7]|uniref:phage tail tape measure protein n=1 Tax=Paenarthrobacter sp. OM7 TaxID=3041264 RepID=UPI0024683B6A|nr:phage tail tape measure protein [Paenarthrobacter sp. OM7]WGM21868.1 phage tail tape measure protein [Paenarthrobacter sp. OM7]
MAERSVVVRVKAEIADFRKQMQEAAKATDEVGKRAQDTAKRSGTALGQMVQSASRHEEAWRSTGNTLLGVGAAISVGVGLAIKSYMAFDKSMSEVRAATHASAGDMELLRAAAIKAGADTAYSAKEAADGITELAKAGVSTKDILGGGLKGALSLAAAGGMEVADAAELAATAMKQFKLTGDQLPHVADLLAAGAGKAQGSVEDLGNALKQGGLIASQTGLSIEETTGGLAAFAASGLLGSDAGTSFKTMLQALTPNSAAAASKMNELGISAFDAQGEFIGLSAFAGNLKDSMKDLTPEARSAAMEIIFGSDAVRAANVLYEEGAAGISKWTKEVNEAGYAAITAAMKQDNLAGDLEKVGGSLDSVFLKSGSGANEVLRDLAQGADKLIDSIGQIPGPVLQATLGVAALAGGGALLAGAFLTLFPRFIEARRHLNELAVSSPRAAAGLTKLGKAATVAGVAMAALQVAGTLANGAAGAGPSFEQMANQILKASKAGDQFGATFDKDFLTNIGDIGSLKDLFKASDQDDFAGFLNNTAKALTGYESTVHRATNALGQADQVLAAMAKNGNTTAAADNFKEFAKASEEAGLSQKKLFDRFPSYRDSLLEQARAVGVNLEEQELYDFALGKIPPRLAAAQSSQEGQAKAAEFQAKATQEATDRLADMGLSADGVVVSLSKLLDSMFAAGLATLSARDAESAYQEALDGLKVKIDEVNASQSAGNQVLDAATGSFDLTSEAGRGASAVFGDLAQKAISTTTAMANNGATQGELQGKLATTYQSLYDTARAFGASEAKADDLARSALNIPKGVPIETAVQNYADTMAKLNGVKSAADSLDGKVSRVTIQTIQETYNRVINGGPDPARPGQIAPMFTGGVVGFAGGGKVPGTPPLNPRMDNIRAMTQNGTPYSVRSGEWIINEPQSKRNDHWLRAVNNGLNLDDVLAYQAPSKSLASGYGSAMGYGGYQEQSASMASVNVDLPDVYVQNPFTGQYLLAQVSTVAQGVVSAADSNSQYNRNGRR